MEDPVVTVAQGRLKGVKKSLSDGTTYFSFKGIPYAQPPVGELRFQAPLPPVPWTGIYEATEHGPVCPQFDEIKNELLEGDENCLFLNVYTLCLQKNQLRPVMVFIHGGGFMYGSGNSDLYGPDFFIQHDVVLVTINYRLEVFGFLCLDTPDVPGNAGMKDQVAALRWVQNNIVQFGGDPNNVTIFGESAGSASVTLHLLSPMSKGLFHKVVAQSGVCASGWAVNNDAKKTAFRLGKALGINTTDITELTQLLKTTPANKLICMTPKLFTDEEKLRNIGFLFCPVVEKKFDNVVPFITEDPMDVLKSNKINKVPLMIGYTSHEGFYFVPRLLEYLDILNKNYEYSLPAEISKALSQERVKALGEKIKKFYVGDKDLSADRISEIGFTIGDPVFVYPAHRFAHMYSKSYDQVYMYKFSCDTHLNFFKKLLGLSHVNGVCHADDLFYMFHTELTSKVLLEEDKLHELVRKVTKLWTNFAKFGNPSDDSLGIRWAPYTTDGKEFLDIDKTSSMGRYADRERVEFWDKLYSEAGLQTIVKQNQQ